jgi:hypothetical protein
MNKKAFLIFLILISVVSSVRSSLPDTIMPLMTSVNQYYSVIFDEEGEALVSLRLNVKNMESTPISTINLEIPGEYVTLMGVLQETSGYETRTCTKYTTGCIEYGQGQTCVQYDYNGNCVKYETPCLRTGKICESYTTHYNYEKIYQKINIEPTKLSHSLSLPIDLITPVQPNGETNLLLVYKAEGYVNKILGSYNFEFESSKTEFMTNNLRVAINVQENLKLKGTSSKINYLPSFNKMYGAMDEAQISRSQSQTIETYANKITYAQGLVKSASYLDPYESFSVKGSYSKSLARLYFGRVFTIILISLAVLIFLIYGFKKIKKYASENIPKKVAQKSSKTKHHFIIPFLSGLFSAIGICLIWVVGIVVIQLSNNIFNYGVRDIFALLIVLIELLITLILLIGIPIYVGNKYGALMGVFSLVSMLGWLFVLIIIIFFVYGLLFSYNRIYPVISL